MNLELNLTSLVCLIIQTVYLEFWSEFLCLEDDTLLRHTQLLHSNLAWVFCDRVVCGTSCLSSVIGTWLNWNVWLCSSLRKSLKLAEILLSSHTILWRYMKVYFSYKCIYKVHLQSSWTHLITLSWNFVAVQWWSLFQSTSLDKLCTSYNTPITHFSKTCCRSLSYGARSELNSVFSLEKVDQWNPIKTSAILSRSGPMRFLGFSIHEEGGPRQEILKW
jgi:hypothetical protein